MTTAQIRGSSIESSRTGAAAFLALAFAIAVAVTPARAGPVAANPVAEIAARVDTGEFQAAHARIDRELRQPSLPAEQRSALEFERERMRRILIDFSLTPEEAMARVRRHIPDLRPEEFAAWDAAGLLEHQIIDGRKLYFARAPSNLFRLSSEAVSRRAAPPEWNDGPLEKAHPHHREVVEAAEAGTAGAGSRRVRVTHSLVVNADAVPPGETIRAWIPYPRFIPGHQEAIRLIGSAPGEHTIAPESTLQRTVYLEQVSQTGAPARFSITYELTVRAQLHRIDPAKVVPARITPALAPHAGERPPHIVFTPALRKFSRDVVGDETNPYEVARRLFEAVDRIPWARAREYSTISNISDYALRAGHADCGQQTLLLMTLLRLNGIPARWQSGWVYSDGAYDNMHDWGWLYLAPYGWVPMDVTFGRLESDDPRIARFYLGGLDAYRIAFNDDFSQPLHPAKQHLRSETVDSQRGEVEWRGGNLYFDQWEYEFRAQVLPRATATRDAT